MRQVGPEYAVARGPADSLTRDAGQRREEVAARLRRPLLRRDLLCRDPCPKLILRMNDDDEEHQRVLQPAILGALADVRSYPPRLDPDAIRLVRDGVHFSRQLR